jgi:t-SNARE syntaxin family protein
MSTDPYHTFAADLRSSLDTARQLSRRYQALQKQQPRRLEGSQRGAPSSSSSSSHSNGIDLQLQDTHRELQDQLEALENDLADIQESVEMLEKRGPELFGVDANELRKRKQFVQTCTDEIRVSRVVQEGSS